MMSQHHRGLVAVALFVAGCFLLAMTGPHVSPERWQNGDGAGIGMLILIYLIVVGAVRAAHEFGRPKR